MYPDMMDNIADALFSTHPIIRQDNMDLGNIGNISAFTRRELEVVVISSLQNKK